MTSKNGHKKFEHEPSGTTFSIAEPVSVATQLRYYSGLGFVAKKEDNYARFWAAARAVIEEWNSELLPDKDTDLETLTDRKTMNKTAQLVMWVGNQVADYMTTQDTVEKN